MDLIQLILLQLSDPGWEVVLPVFVCSAHPTPPLIFCFRGCPPCFCGLNMAGIRSHSCPVQTHVRVERLISVHLNMRPLQINPASSGLTRGGADLVAILGHIQESITFNFDIVAKGGMGCRFSFVAHKALRPTFIAGGRAILHTAGLDLLAAAR